MAFRPGRTDNDLVISACVSTPDTSAQKVFKRRDPELQGRVTAAEREASQQCVMILWYLGSMLSRPNTPFEEEVQRILDEGVPEQSDAPAQQDEGIENEESAGVRSLYDVIDDLGPHECHQVFSSSSEFGGNCSS